MFDRHAMLQVHNLGCLLLLLSGASLVRQKVFQRHLGTIPLQLQEHRWTVMMPLPPVNCLSIILAWNMLVSAGLSCQGFVVFPVPDFLKLGFCQEPNALFVL